MNETAQVELRTPDKTDGHTRVEPLTPHKTDDGMRPEQKPLLRVLISAGRSGTHWLKEMISAALGTPPVEQGAWDTQTLQGILEGCGRRQLVYEHFRFNLHGAILDPARYPDMRIVLLHRHPFDQFISTAWYHLRIDNLWRGKINGLWELPDPDLDPSEVARAMLIGEYDDRIRGSRGSYAVRWFIESLEWTTINWIESGRCCQVKYEDLVERTEEELIRVLNHLEIRFDEADIPQIVERNRFENLSGGRSRGEADGSHHYRKGTPGEWRSVFTDDDMPILRERYGDCLARLGYSI
ncbi:MAG: sulfotransferase domain-containing protein [Planctomycetaceae bacterium]